MLTKTLIIASLAGALGLASSASADRSYGSRGPTRYEAQRYQASIRYDRGSRNYAHTYERYGQARYDLHTDYDRDYYRRYRAGPRYYSGAPGYNGWSFGFSYGSGGYWGGDSVNLRFGYSAGPRYYTPAPRYYAPTVYRYDYAAPRYYSAPSYYAPSYYAPPAYGGYYSSGGYYCR